MDILRDSISVLFFQYPLEGLILNFQELRTVIIGKESNPNNWINKDLFIQLFGFNSKYTNDEIETIYNLAMQQWIQKKNIFELLNTFTEKTLYQNKGMPIVHFKQLFRWHSLSSLIGEDCLIISYLAKNDIEKCYNRKNFSWPVICQNDNSIINDLCKDKLTELHFHLNGSSDTFTLTWVCWMNHIEKRGLEFKKIEGSLFKTLLINRNQKIFNYNQLVIMAAFIRLNLYNKLKSINCLNLTPWDYLMMEHGDASGLQRHIDICRSLYGIAFKDGLKYDYALDDKSLLGEVTSTDININPLMSVYGERIWMYNVFHAIYSGQESFIFPLYLYTLIKSKMRAEFIQVNSRSGFDNFSDYEIRKDCFLDNYRKYKDLIQNISFNLALVQGHVGYLESRITMKSNLVDQITLLNKKNESFSGITRYIIHFIKKREKHILFTERNHKVRLNAKKTALLLSHFLQKSPKLANLIVGIDAANTELYCRPEVFAQSFRYLREKAIDTSLSITFHVGEDFFDIIDGLRSIDECIHFLGMRTGDRLGHCIALGIDPNKFAKRHHNIVAINKLTCLDNITWLLKKCREYSIDLALNTKDYLKEQYNSLIVDIYNEWISIDDYYCAMMLRGDNPQLYQAQDARLNDKFRNLAIWESYALISSDEERKNAKARKFYFKYHFDSEVAKRGEQIVSFKLFSNYGEVITNIQDHMMDIIERNEIHIECCPTSNCKIGNFELYEDHPIFRFFDSGITSKSRHQLSVSINTDDQGVFNTSLINEYSLIALALYKKKDNNNNCIYSRNSIRNWIRDVAENANNARFHKRT